MRELRVDYDEVATTFDRRYELTSYPDLEQLVQDFAAQRRLLEVGCGTGYWLDVSSANGARVAGTDPSTAMLDRARDRVANADLRLGQAEAIPWGEASFDRVLCINALHHFADPARFFEEAHRVLSPGGAVLVVGLDPDRGDDRWWIYDWFERALELDRARYPAAWRIREWMAAAGFVDAATAEAQHLAGDFAARDVLGSDFVAKHSTSQLVLLSDAEYQQGIDAIRAECQTDPSLTLRVDLRLWGTQSWRR